MVYRRRTNIALLTQAETETYSDLKIHWCSINSPINPVNLARLCVVNLFLQNQNAVQRYCKRIVTLNTRLPVAIGLFNSLWAVASRNELKFSIVCNDGKSTIRVISPPIGILEVLPSCTATSDSVTLSSSYDTTSAYDITDSDLDLLRSFNISGFSGWAPLVESFPNFTKIALPKPLREIKTIWTV